MLPDIGGAALLANKDVQVEENGGRDNAIDPVAWVIFETLSLSKAAQTELDVGKPNRVWLDDLFGPSLGWEVKANVITGEFIFFSDESSAEK